MALLQKSTSDKKKSFGNDYQKSYDKAYKKKSSIMKIMLLLLLVKIKMIGSRYKRIYRLSLAERMKKKKNLELEVSALDMAYKGLIQRQEAGDKRISDAQIEAAKNPKKNKEKS